MRLVLPWKRENLSEVWTWPQIFWLNVFGWWAEEASTEKRRKLLRYWRAFTLAYLIGSVLSITMAVVVKILAGVIEKDLLGLFILPPTALGAYTTIQVVRYRVPLKKAMNLFDDLTRGTTEPEDMELLRSRMTKPWFIFSIVQLSVGTNVLHWTIRPIMYALLYGKKSHILDSWPSFMDTWTQFMVTYVCQVFSISLFGFTFTMFPSIFFCIAECILCHMAILRNNLEKVRLNTDSKVTLNMKKLLNDHLKILEMCDNLNYASKSVLIMQAIVTALTYCFGLFIITMSEVNVNIIMNLIESTLLVTVIFFFSCWYSNEIALQSGYIGQSAYMSQWMDGSEKEKKAVLILMTRALRPVKYGSFLQLDLNSFLSVLKTAFSYYNFLLAVVEK